MMFHISRIVFSSLLLGLLTTAAQAETATRPKDHDQQQLQSVLKELDKASKQRQQHNTQVDELAQQLECNWTLIRAYEACGKLHKNDPDGHLKCSTNAKQNAQRCLGSGEK